MIRYNVFLEKSDGTKCTKCNKTSKYVIKIDTGNPIDDSIYGYYCSEHFSNGFDTATKYKDNKNNVVLKRNIKDAIKFLKDNNISAERIIRESKLKRINNDKSNNSN